MDSPDRTPETGLRVERVLGRAGGIEPGPVVVITGGIHGNEPAGAIAARRVVEDLARRSMPVRGRVVAVAGNRKALARGCRYVDRDLNRQWSPDRIAELRQRDPDGDTVEDREQRELLEVFEDAARGADGPVIFFDLHSSSGEGAPFACQADTLRNRRIALALPVPLILGLEEVIDGSMLGYLSDLGHCGVAFEGGQHDDPATVRKHVAATWIVLVAVGAIRAADVPELAEHRRTLAAASAGLPRVVEIRHRHVVASGNGFRMEPGFASFDRVARGQALARESGTEVRALEGGRLLLPRYQGQGEDGFFLARDVRPFWLRVSAGLRRLRLDRLVPWLPGVSRHPTLRDHLVVDPETARWLAVEVMHLFGYRRRRPEGDSLVFSRRTPDGRVTPR